MIFFFFFLASIAPASLSWFPVTRSGLFSWLPTFPFSILVAVKKRLLMSHTLAWCIVQTATFAPLLFSTAFDVCSVTPQRSYWEKREPAVTPTAVAAGSWQVLESLHIWVAPPSPRPPEKWLLSSSVLGSQTCPCSCFLYRHTLSHHLSWPLAGSVPSSTLSLKTPHPQSP